MGPAMGQSARVGFGHPLNLACKPGAVPHDSDSEFVVASPGCSRLSGVRATILLSLCLTMCSPPTRPGEPPKTDVRYALVVSFGSECCGTDQDAERALAAIVGRYPEKALGHTRGYWGKEGEVDECFTLDGLDTLGRARFVREVRAGVTRKLVDVDENAPCRADR